MTARTALLLALLASPAAAATPATAPVPPAPMQAFHEVVYGVDIDDPYRWMESPSNKAEMEAWLRKSSAASVAWMASLPEHDAFARIVNDAMRAGVRYTDATAAGALLFYRRQDPADRTAKLVVRRGGAEQVLFDPAGGANGVVAMGSYSVSPDGALVAVQASSGGAEIGDIRFLKVADGSQIGAPLGPAFSEDTVAWLKNGWIAYTRMSPPGVTADPMQNMHVMVTRVGDGPGTTVLGTAVTGAPPFAPAEWPLLFATPTSDWLIGIAAGSQGYARRFATRVETLAAGKPVWRTVADYSDQTMDSDVIGDDVFLLSTLGAPNGKIVRQTLGGGGAEVVLPESDLILEHTAATNDGLYVVGVRDGVDHLLFLPGGRGAAREVTLPFDGYLPNLRTSRDGASAVFSLNGWTTEASIYEARAGKASSLGLASSSWAGAEGVAVTRDEAVSADGTRVPMVIMRPRGAAAGVALPTILEGYGAYGINNTEPWYNPPNLAWVAHGGGYAFCGTRGGNERGRLWHEDGREARKPNAQADFIACAERLESTGMTRADHLVAIGTSAGGTLVPPAVINRPDLFAGLISRVAETNVTRLEAAENGANQFAEFGDPRTEAGFKALLAQDAYIGLTRARDLPPTLVTVGLNDPRVSPWINAKFTARALERFGDRKLILVRADDEGGHGFGSARDRLVAEWADTFAFAWAVTHQTAP